MSNVPPFFVCFPPIFSTSRPSFCNPARLLAGCTTRFDISLVWEPDPTVPILGGGDCPEFREPNSGAGNNPALLLGALRPYFLFCISRDFSIFSGHFVYVVVLWWKRGGNSYFS